MNHLIYTDLTYKDIQSMLEGTIVTQYFINYHNNMILYRVTKDVKYFEAIPLSFKAFYIILKIEHDKILTLSEAVDTHQYLYSCAKMSGMSLSSYCDGILNFSKILSQFSNWGVIAPDSRSLFINQYLKH